MVNGAGPEEDPAAEAVAQEERRLKDLRNERDRATYKAKQEAKKLAKKQEAAAIIRSRRARRVAAAAG